MLSAFLAKPVEDRVYGRRPKLLVSTLQDEGEEIMRVEDECRERASEQRKALKMCSDEGTHKENGGELLFLYVHMPQTCLEIHPILLLWHSTLALA